MASFEENGKTIHQVKFIHDAHFRWLKASARRSTALPTQVS